MAAPRAKAPSSAPEEMELVSAPEEAKAISATEAALMKIGGGRGGKLGKGGTSGGDSHR